MFVRGEDALVSMLGLEMSPAHTLPGPAPQSSLAAVLPGWGPRAGQALCLEGVILRGQWKVLLLGSVARGSAAGSVLKVHLCRLPTDLTSLSSQEHQDALLLGLLLRQSVSGRGCCTFSEPELVTAVLSSNNRARRSSFQPPSSVIPLEYEETTFPVGKGLYTFCSPAEGGAHVLLRVLGPKSCPEAET